MWLAVPLAKSTLTTPLSNFFTCSAFCRSQMDLRPLVTDEVAKPTPTSPTCIPSLRFRRWRQGCAGGKCSVCCCSLCAHSCRGYALGTCCSRRSRAASSSRPSRCSACPFAPAHATSGAARVRFWQLSTECPADIGNDSEVRAPECAETALVLNESCERHCAQTHGEFGCRLCARRVSAISVFVSRPLEVAICAAGCLLCDQKANSRLCDRKLTVATVAKALWNALRGRHKYGATNGNNMPRGAAQW